MGRLADRTRHQRAGALSRAAVGARGLLRRGRLRPDRCGDVLRGRGLCASNQHHAVESCGDRAALVHRADAADLGERLRGPRSDFLLLLHAARITHRVCAPCLARRNRTHHAVLAHRRGGVYRAGTDVAESLSVYCQSTLSPTSPYRRSGGRNVRSTFVSRTNRLPSPSCTNFVIRIALGRRCCTTGIRSIHTRASTGRSSASGCSTQTVSLSHLPDACGTTTAWSIVLE